MDDAKFDRLARALTMTMSRRWLVVLAGAVMGMLGQQVARGVQLGPAVCGEEGAVCTHIAECCDGLTCVTSAINTSYGICVPGEGGMVSTGTTLISPFSETAVEEATALLENAPTASETNPRADRQARIADIRARRDAKRAESTTGLTTRRSTTQTPKFKTPRPQLKLQLTTSTKDDPKTAEDVEVKVDTIEATNRSDTSIVLTRIASLLAPEDGSSLTTEPSKFTLAPGESYFFVAGLTVADATNDRFDWANTAACDGGLGAGYLVKAAFSVASTNRDFKILCDRASVAANVDTASETSRGKRKRQDQRQKKKKR